MVWWDTSRVSHQWYEQGTNRQRWLNWGRPLEVHCFIRMGKE